MIYSLPVLTDSDHAVLDLIQSQRERLKLFTEGTAPRRWIGSLRRSTFARAIQGSNSIEGYKVSVEDAIAAVENEPISENEPETWNAIMGYRNAMTYIMQAAQDPYFEFSKQFFKSLHFMMISYDMGKNPGQWRPGSIFVVDNKTRKKMYEAPDAELVNPLVEELVDQLKSDKGPVIAKAAVAHLNLTMIHPFKDGNGRMARAVQTLVLAQEGILHPVFSSIEEWLGSNTQEYYDILAETGKGKWNPQRDSLPWVRFCFKAHFQQAATLLRRNEEYSLLFDGVQNIVKREKLPERSEMPLFNAALGFRVTNGRYRNDAEVSDFIASRDLKRLCEVGLLDPKGEKRGRIYSATKELRKLRDSIRITSPMGDPYEIISSRKRSAQLSLLPPQ